MKKPRKIGRWNFGTIKEAKAFANEHLRKQLLKVPIKGEFDEFLHALVTTPENIHHGLSIGVEFFQLQTGRWRRDHLFAYLTEGRGSTCCGWNDLLEGAPPPTHEEHVRKAFRDAIIQQTRAIYQPGYERHHSGKTMSYLIEEFLKQNNKTFEDIKIFSVGLWWVIEDPVLRARWEVFHKLNADLQNLRPEVHREIHAAERRKKDV